VCVVSVQPRSARPLQVLRVSHSSVVASWRQRERWLEKLGASVTLVTAKSWAQGGTEVPLKTSPGEQVKGVQTFGRHPCGFFYEPFALWRALRSVPHDVLDAHEEPYSVAALELVLLRWLAGTRRPMLLYSAQNLQKRPPFPFGFTQRLVLASAKGAYPCNEGAAANLRRRGFPGVVRVVPLGVDAPGAAAESGGRRYEERGGGLRIGCAGRLVQEKGFRIAIEAVASEPSWTLRVAGEGPERENLLWQAKALEAAQRVHLLGHCDEAAMADFYGSIDVLVVPSLPRPSWQEQFGRVAVEAMAAGVPVVASSSGSLPEVVGDAGMLVPPGDPAALHDALATLDQQLGRLKGLADEGLRRARAYAWEAVAEMQLRLYRDVLGESLSDSSVTESSLPALEVAVVAYGRPELLSRALAALQPTGSSQAYPVIVVDNSSDPGIKKVVASYGACYIDPGRNLGFAAAVNVALANVGRPDSDVLLLNPDAEVGPATVAHLQRRLHAEARLSCVAPAQLSPEGKAQRVAWPFPTPLRAWLEALGLHRIVATPDFLTGSVLLLNGTALAEVGWLDERFFLYAEETDWQRRARALGWGSRLCPELSALHVGGASSEHDKRGRELLFASAGETYFRKWHGPLGWQLSRMAIVFGALVRALLSPGRRSAALRRAACYASGPVRLSSRYDLVPTQRPAARGSRGQL